MGGRLLRALSTGNWAEAETVLGSLSHSEMRRMEKVVREDLLPQLRGDVFWDAWAWLVAYRAQAFLPGIVAISQAASDGTLDLQGEALRRVACSLTPEQAGKAFSMAAHHLRLPSQMAHLVEAFSHAGTERLAIALARETSPLAYHALLQVLLRDDAPHALVLTCALRLFRKGDDLSLNMVSILKTHFQLTELPARLALRIEPYELSYINASYTHFRYVVEGKKPRV